MKCVWDKFYSLYSKNINIIHYRLLRSCEWKEDREKGHSLAMDKIKNPCSNTGSWDTIWHKSSPVSLELIMTGIWIPILCARRNIKIFIIKDSQS